MAPRKKEDFLTYARRSAYAPAGRRSQYAPDNNEGATNSSIDLRGAATSDDGPIESEYRGSEIEQRTDSWSSSSEQGSDGTEPDYSYVDGGGEQELDTGGDRDFNVDGGYDISVRNVSSNTSEFDTAIPATPRTRRRRVSFIDNLLSRGVEKTTTKKPAPKQASPVARKLLTLAEVAKYRPGLIKLIMFSSDHLDDGITAITKGHRPVIIWSDIVEADAEILSEAFLEAGQRSAYVAEKVRWVMEWEKKVKVGVILAPRIYKSIVYTVVTGIQLRW